MRVSAARPNCPELSRRDCSEGKRLARGRTILLFLAAALGAAGAARAQGTQPYTPRPGDAERQAILDALRAPVERQLRQKVIFRVDHLKVQDGWAFVRGAPQRPGGGAIDYSGTPYQTAVEEGAFDDGIVALLRRRQGKWRVVQYVVGATDVPYVDWDKRFRAPSAVFRDDDDQ
jgi:hypothetical protein